jgi:excisionase family DNA binding protein
MDQTPLTVPAMPALGGTLYTPQEVAKLLHVSSRTVQRWIKTRTLTAVRYGTLLRIREVDLAAFGEVLTKSTPALASAEPDEAG